MAAIIPPLGYCGAKVYTAAGPRFSFIILLFSMTTGEPLASFDAGPLTALRTAAVSCLAAGFLARRNSRRLTVFGTGTQARAHVRALAHRFALERIDVVARAHAAEFAQEIREQTGIECGVAMAAQALRSADLVVTATRAREPLFDGALVRPGTTIFAIGSARADAAEIDARTLARSARIAVESTEVALHEAGDLLLAEAAGTSVRPKLVELGALAHGSAAGRASDDEINVFESVGSALEDVAIAAAAYERMRHVAKT
jgi:ornithine cyclodeaminase